MNERLDSLVQLLVPALLVVAVGVAASTASRSNEIHFLNALVAVAMVVAIYVFVLSAEPRTANPEPGASLISTVTDA